MLNRSSQSRHPCLLPNVSGEAFIFCPLSMMLAVHFLYMAFIMLRNGPSIPILLSVFIINGCRILSNAFFCIYCYDHVIFVFPFVYVMFYIYWFGNIVPSLHPWDESHLIMVYDLFNVLLVTNIFCQYFVEDFSVFVHHCYWPLVFFLCCVFIWFWD